MKSIILAVIFAAVYVVNADQFDDCVTNGDNAPIPGGVKACVDSMWNNDGTKRVAGKSQECYTEGLKKQWNSVRECIANAAKTPEKFNELIASGTKYVKWIAKYGFSDLVDVQ